MYVSGTIGDSALGLMLQQGKKIAGLGPEDEAFLKERHLAPEPRLGVSRGIRSFAKACVDISDGLVADIGHIAQQSAAQITLHADQIPLSPAAQKAVRANPALFETLITGGEDYELAFAVDGASEGLLTIVGPKVNVPLTKIGVMEAGTAGDIQVLDKERHVIPLKSRGWAHF
jgi:thiamine-monophosphate kinase